MNIIPIPGFSEPFNSISHLAFAVYFFISSFYLINKGRGNSGRVIGLLIYCFGLIFLLSMSGTYHLLEKGRGPNHILHILDHVGIYVLIAGTFTPIHLILFRGVHRWLVLVVVWTLCIAGLTLSAVFFNDIPEIVNLSVFLSLGWIGVYTLWKIYHMHSKKLRNWMIYSGLAYTIGALIDFANFPILIDGVIGPHEIFHVFVIIGIFFHWKLVDEISEYPISSKIKIIVRELPGSKFEAIATSEHVFFTGSSLEEIKNTVLKWIDDKYHHEMRPTQVTFKYTQEEDIFLD